jgi:hypothetical protein
MGSTGAYDPGRLAAVFEKPPDPDDYPALWRWLYMRLGLKLAVKPVCPGHTSPYDMFWYKYKFNPHTSIVHGPRGGGKSMMAGIGAHLKCRWNPGYRVKILGGSKQQSAQVYEAMADVVAPVEGRSDGPIDRLNKESATYHNGSEIKILAASQRSVRGPHGPHLIADEVDEQDPALLSAAVGMVQEYRDKGFPPIVEYTSTWHNVGGNMDAKIHSADATKTPLFTFCIFEVMERCPDEFSGENLENCPACPIFAHCWADRLDDRRKPPRAKLSTGHYTLQTVLNKVYNISPREFEADYLCLGPKVEGAWFRNYHDALNVDAERGEYDPAAKVHISIDYGVCTGAVFFQVRNRRVDGRMVEDVCVFAEYYGEGLTAGENARAVREIAWKHCQGRIENVTMDSAARSREGAGTTGLAEWHNAGFTKIKTWPKVKNKKEDLEIIDTFVLTAAGTRHLFVHPRCVGLRGALQQYRRAKVGPVWTEDPKSEQHPWEEYVDAMAGGLHVLYPLGRRTGRKALAVNPNRLA